MEHHFFKRIKKTIKHWYLPLISGIILIAIGVLTFMYPADSYVGLSYLFSISFVVSGLLETYFSISNRDTMDNWGWHLVSGIVSLLIGVLMFMNPAISIITLPFYVGFMILFRSVGAIGISLDLKNYGVLNWGNLMVVGILGIILSFILLWNPMIAGLSVVAITGMALIAGGIFNIMVSFKLKKVHDVPRKISKELMKQYDEVEDEIINALDNPEA